MSQVKVNKMSNTRILFVCRLCLTRAKEETQDEIRTFSILSGIHNSLQSLSDTASDRNNTLIAAIMHKLAQVQSNRLNNEIKAELKTPKTHELLRSECEEIVFLSKINRNSVLIQTLLGFGNIKSNTNLENMSEKKLYALCSAYEAVLSLKHSNVTTAPAVKRNLILYKATHSANLVESVGSPSGGRHSLLSQILNSDLPPLPTPHNDFISCDDNLQIKRVTSSSKLKENFKHTVKVVNSHVFFQNEKDTQSQVLKNESNQPKYWLKPPTKSEVDEFEAKILSYETEARKVRTCLVEGWLSEELADINANRDPASRLSWLRRTRPGEHVLYPCPSCGGEGRLY